MKTARKKFERELAKQPMSNRNACYAHINQKTKVKSKVGPLIDATKVVRNIPKEMVDMINILFSFQSSHKRIWVIFQAQIMLTEVRS